MAAKSTISSKRAATSRLRRPRSAPARKTFSRPERSGWNPAKSSIMGLTRPSTATVPPSAG